MLAYVNVTVIMIKKMNSMMDPKEEEMVPLPWAMIKSF